MSDCLKCAFLEKHSYSEITEDGRGIPKLDYYCRKGHVNFVKCQCQFWIDKEEQEVEEKISNKSCNEKKLHNM